MDKTAGRHISSQFDEELRTICGKTLSMSHLVEQQVGDALDALLRCDVELAEQVVQRDYQVNAYEVTIDEECTTILARRQPTGKDLRCIIAVIKTITDLERIGDEAKNIASQVLDLQKNPHYTHYLVEIGHLGKQVLDILQRSIVIFEQMNAGSAAELICEESGLDKSNENINRQLITYMMEDPRAVPQIIELMWAMRALERMGDRACNICNYVIYCAKGELTHSK
jgi:phosphate transport system protein